MRKSRKLFSVLVLAVLALLVVGPGVASAAPAQSPSAAPTAGGFPCCWYQVRWGDTLSGIASRYGVSTTYLQQLNGIANRDFIRAGMWLRVPCGFAFHPFRHYFWSSVYGCWGYSYWNSFYGRNIFICTG